MQMEMHGSAPGAARSKSSARMLIDQLLKAEVENKSAVSLAEVRAYYDKNPARFQQPESFSIQSISILPPQKTTPEVIEQNRKRAEDALRQAKVTRNYEEFGLLAEKISEDDFRVNMGDHKALSRDKLPPQIVQAAEAMQLGEVSGAIQIQNAFTIFRLNAHNPARLQPFGEVKADLRTELGKSRYERLRSNLAKRLRANAKIEIVVSSPAAASCREEFLVASRSLREASTTVVEIAMYLIPADRAFPTLFLSSRCVIRLAERAYRAARLESPVDGFWGPDKPLFSVQ